MPRLIAACVLTMGRTCYFRARLRDCAKQAQLALMAALKARIDELEAAVEDLRRAQHRAFGSAAAAQDAPGAQQVSDHSFTCGATLESQESRSHLLLAIHCSSILFGPDEKYLHFPSRSHPPPNPPLFLSPLVAPLHSHAVAAPCLHLTYPSPPVLRPFSYFLVLSSSS